MLLTAICGFAALNGAKFARNPNHWTPPLTNRCRGYPLSRVGHPLPRMRADQVMVGVSMLRRLRAIVAAGLVCGIALGRVAHAQKDPVALNVEAERLYRAGRFAEATEIAKRLLASGENVLGHEHPSVA